MNKHRLLLSGISVLPALLVMPAMADTISERLRITENTTYTDLVAEDISSAVSNNGGVFYLENAQDVTLTFNGETSFSNNAITGGGMGGAIGNGWLTSSAGWNPYTPGGKIVFNGETTFDSNTTSAKNGGGAILNYGVGMLNAPDIVFNDTAVFTNNAIISTNETNGLYGGGAIHHHGGAIVFNGNAEFSDNISTSNGGAILAYGDIEFKDDAIFTNNSANSKGGAIAAYGNITFDKKATFSENTAGNGGAISMDASNIVLTFKDKAVFIDNTGTAILLNNKDSGEICFENGAEFYTNTNIQNGSLQNAGLVTLTGGDFKFYKNTGSNGGGLKSSGTVTVDTTGDVLFSENETTSSAGAFDNGGTATFTANKITFNENKAASGYGGAIFNGADISLLGSENIFTKNEAKDTKVVKSGGGAIHNRGNKNTTTFILGTEDSTNTFSENVSLAHGGAIAARAVDGVGQDSSMTINGNTTFYKNNATVNGGAIWNYIALGGTGDNANTYGSADIDITGASRFSTNTAGADGGAIYNNGTMTFDKDVAFITNTATQNGGAIFNDGTMDFADIVSFTTNTANNGGAIYNTDTMSFAKAVDFTGNTATVKGGAIYNTGTMNFGNGATFTGNRAKGVANDIYNDGSICLNGVTTLDGGIVGEGSLDVAQDATLDIGTASITQDVINLDGTLFATVRDGDSQITANTFTGGGKISLAMENAGTYRVFGNAIFDNTSFDRGITSDNAIYNLDWSDDGTTVTANRKTVAEIVDTTGVSNDAAQAVSALAQSNDETANQMAVVAQQALARGETVYVEQELSKMNPEKSPVASTVALSVQNQVMATAGERMSLPLTGRSGGDVQADLGVWAKGMYNKTKHNGFFDAHTWGGSVGVDTELNHSVLFGAGYSFGITNVDFDNHDVDIDSNTIFVYAQYRNSDWFINGTIAYTMSDYDWNKNVFGVATNPSYKANALSEQVMGGYHFANGMTPTLGLRYLDVHQDSYKDGITTVAGMNSTYLTGVAGVDYKYTWIAPYTSLFWNPELHLAATYDMISDSEAAWVMVPGAAAYTVESKNLSRFGGEFGVGITAEYYYLTVALNYDLNLHKDYTSQTASFKVKYKF